MSVGYRVYLAWDYATEIAPVYRSGSSGSVFLFKFPPAVFIGSEIDILGVRNKVGKKILTDEP